MEFGRQVVSGIKWASSSRFGRIVLQYFTLFILIQYLSPKDFGLMSTALIFMGFFDIIKDFGLNIGLIQLEDESESLYSSIFWSNLVIGLFFSALLFITSNYIAMFYNEQELSIILKVLSFNFFINSFGILQQTLFEKELKFNITAKIELFASLVGSLTGITLAILGLGVWALVFQSLSISITTGLSFFFTSNFRPKLFFRINEVKKILNFGVNFSLFNILNYFVRNSDYFLIGKYIGMSELGIYSLAYRIMLIPIQNISSIISKVLYPAISKIKNDNERIQKIYLSIAQSVAFLTFPLMIGFFVLNDFAIKFFFQKEWFDIIDILYILIPIGMIQSVYTLGGVIFQSKNRTDLWLKWGIFSALITVSGFIIGLKWGIMGVAVSYLISNFILFIPGSKISLKLIKMSFAKYLFSFSNIFLISFFMGLSVLFIKIALVDILSPILLILLLIISGLAVYLILSYKFNKPLFNEILYRVKGNI